MSAAAPDLSAVRLPYPLCEQGRPASPLRSPLRYQSMRPSELPHGFEPPTEASSPWKQARDRVKALTPKRVVQQVAAITPKATVNPIVHLATALLAALAGCVNAIGIGMFATTIGNVTGLVTKLAVDVIDSVSEFAVVMQFVSFFLGSVLSGMLISSRKVGMGTELYGIVLLLVSALLFAGWATAAWAAPGIAQCLLAASMALQNGMLTKHAHAVVRTTHMTGITTDIGVIIGHQIGRWLHDLALRKKMVQPDSPEKRKAIRNDRLKEWTQLKLLSLLLISFFGGGLVGFAMFRAAGANALLLPAFTEAAMGVGYFTYRTLLRPRWKRLVVARNAKAAHTASGGSTGYPAEPAQLMDDKA